MRSAEIKRETQETTITLVLALEGPAAHRIQTGSGFLDHMLELLAYHGNFQLTIDCSGDREVDFHHTTEDVAIALGKAFRQALADPRGIGRYGSAAIPMDEALVLVAVDLSGRAALGYRLQIPTEKVGEFDTELIAEFMAAFSRSLGAAIHLHQLAGENSHHIIEAAFKGLGRALAQAVVVGDRDAIPSSKGLLDWGPDA